MRRVTLDAVVTATAPGTVFETVVRFDRYPELAPHVRSTTIHSGRPGSTGRSSWELHFRSGLLRWTERELFHRDELRIEFQQTDGDFESFEGLWTLLSHGQDCAVHFQADFDFGIPSLEGILDPIAERVIRETVAWALVGMFDGVRLAGDLDVARPVSGAAEAGTGIAT